MYLSVLVFSGSIISGTGGPPERELHGGRNSEHFVQHYGRSSGNRHVVQKRNRVKWWDMAICILYLYIILLYYFIIFLNYFIVFYSLIFII